MGLGIVLLGLAFGFVIVQPLAGFSVHGTVEQPYSAYLIGYIDSSKMDVCVTADKPTTAYLLTSDAYGIWLSTETSPAIFGNVSSPFNIGGCSTPPGSSVYYIVLVPNGNESGYQFSESVNYYPIRDLWQLVVGIGGGVLAAEVVEVVKDRSHDKQA